MGAILHSDKISVSSRIVVHGDFLCEKTSGLCEERAGMPFLLSGIIIRAAHND